MRRNKCPFCTQVFSYATAKLNHIERQHANLAEAYYQYIVNQPQEAGDRQGPWTATTELDVFRDDDRPLRRSSRLNKQTTIYPQAGEAIPSDDHRDTPPENSSQPASSRWFPFENEQEFALANWMITNKLTKTAIDVYLQQGHGNLSPGEFQSAYTLRQKVDSLLPLGGWVRGDAIFNHGTEVPFFY